ncbi:hypothetical protein Misp01_23870 [Microtetraspora sp. NBRC 13810]|uniref:hypothetical protein n=1 Tax=Microtetraspora sp. NBRC 13810 TaxID=3030990 RepID=UPI0024A20EE6|nr:hypothetical protein [Microtetraspora sp. NBRC 13810]GLW07257.1 hypothetical protein Misp01_23870 [Microtetraspora sp. NBRC 13810]
MRPLLAILATALLPLTAAAQPARTADCATTTARADFDGDGVDDVVAGDPFADVRGLTGAGAVQVVSGRGATALAALEPAAGDGFGWSVALARVDSDACADLLVGVPYADVAGRRDAGAVHILYGGTKRGTVLVAPEPQQDAHFGWSLARDSENGTAVAIGAPYEDDGDVPDAGAVYLFGGGTTALVRITQESDGVPGSSEAGDLFGWAAALGRLSGERGPADLAVGSPYENDDGAGRQAGQGMADTGGLTVVDDPLDAGGRYTGRRWGMPDLVGPAEARQAPGDRFGHALAYADGMLAVSAPLADAAGTRDTGLVHLLRPGLRQGTTFHRGSGPGDAFGFSLALTATGQDGVRLAVGIPLAGPDDRGAVQVIPLDAPGQATLLTAPQSRPGDHFGWSVAFSGNRLAAGIPDAPGGGALALLGRMRGAFTMPPPASPGLPTDIGASLGG